MRRAIAFVTLVACHGAHQQLARDGAAVGDGNGALVLPTPGLHFDYQLGGAYPPPASVAIVSRDRTAMPASALYNICYVNGFQIQPDEASWWSTQHPDLILRDASGQPVIDTAWNEMLIDVSATKRAAVGAIVGGWIDGCKQAGFDAVEIDNLDSYTRSQNLLTADDAVAMESLFAQRAHAQGIPIAQKNTTDLVARQPEMATDFAVAEECVHYQECPTYTARYGAHVLVIEYQQADYNAGCAQFPQLSIVLRDRNLVPAGQPGYVFASC
jgi:hypothetical protein